MKVFKTRWKALFATAMFVVLAATGYGQEFEGPVFHNPFVGKRASYAQAARKITATLSLPFFEDFTTYSVFPDSTKWVDYHVYINNTMCVKPVSRGVATFDDLTWRGLPYDSFSNTAFKYADSLTSQPIDLQAHTPGDSLYLSFFYQPQGNGFFPLAADSLILYFKTRFGGYVKIWSVPGTILQPFRQVMIPVTDSLYFHDAFQFRFVNKAAHYWADAVWNVDYVKLDAGRSMNDTVINDVAFTSDPGVLLNDYTSMPYRQFMVNPGSERTAQLRDSIRNNYGSSQSVTYGFTASSIIPSSVLQPVVTNSVSIGSGITAPVSFPSYTATVPLSSVGWYDRVVFENKFFLQSPSSIDPLANDTIVRQQVFDNYLAYDDGTAEKSYYLNLYPTLPGKISIEYYLNQRDTMRGMAIYFGRQIPFATYKTFLIQVYSSLAGVSGGSSDDLIYQQDFCQPGYADTVNHFWVYKLDNPVPLEPGTFYAGTMQPAESGSDSLYFGLDVNRIGGNHVYFNVIGSWVPSLISGAVMIRPLFGPNVVGSAIAEMENRKQNWEISPNPAMDILKVDFKGDKSAVYKIADLQGHTVLEGETKKGADLNVSALIPGMYIMHLAGEESVYAPQRFMKL